MATYTPYSDPDKETFRIEILRNLEYVIDQVEDAINVHARDIFELLTRLLFDLSKDEKRNEELFQMTGKCLLKSAQSAPKEFRALFSGMEDEQVNPVFDQLYRETFKAL